VLARRRHSRGIDMEIFPHVHQLQSQIADRHLFQYLFVGDNVLLLDTGMAATPEAVILPYLKKLGIPPERLTLAVNTHADADHHGGNAALRHIGGRVLLACGEADREVIESPDRLFALRYNQWIAEHGVGLGLNHEAEQWVRGIAGPAHRIDLTLRGGETLAIDGSRTLRVLHVPGHSNGHLAFYDAGNRAVFVGDALHGSNCPAMSGAPSLPPAYFAVLAYLSTVQLIESLEVEWIYSAHWPTYRGDQVREFLDECRRFVEMAGGQVRKALERHPEGVTLRECIEECGPALGRFPENNRWLLMYPLYGHLSHLEQLGEVTRIKTGDRIGWKAAM
jgi:glyoxylase-like metal-dependent hydrolase (beta-lactamase superfamily II)